jgi:hypothetical protein
VLHDDEVLVGGFGERHAVAPSRRERVPGRDVQVDPLLVEPARAQVRRLRQRRGQAQVDLAVPQAREQPVPVVLHQREPDQRAPAAEVLQQPRHGLAAERV